MNRIVKGAVIAGLGADGVIGTASAASVYTPNADGTTSVTKGEVQTALGWNNADFDANVGKARDVKFVVAAERVYVDHPMLCLNLTTGEMRTVGHRRIVQPGTATISATQTLSGNGKQINGWTLTGGAGVRLHARLQCRGPAPAARAVRWCSTAARPASRSPSPGAAG